MEKMVFRKHISFFNPIIVLSQTEFCKCPNKKVWCLGMSDKYCFSILILREAMLAGPEQLMSGGRRQRKQMDYSQVLMLLDLCHLT